MRFAQPSMPTISFQNSISLAFSGVMVVLMCSVGHARANNGLEKYMTDHTSIPRYTYLHDNVLDTFRNSTSDRYIHHDTPILCLSQNINHSRYMSLYRRSSGHPRWRRWRSYRGCNRARRSRRENNIFEARLQLERTEKMMIAEQRER